VNPAVTYSVAAAGAAATGAAYCYVTSHVDAQLPDDDGYYDPDMDPWERAFDYQFNRVLRANALPGQPHS
jgi:hypothetical protein